MEKLKRNLEFLTAALAISGAVYFVLRVPGCGTTKPEQVSYNPGTGKCGDIELGKTKTTVCSDGKSKKVEACTENGLTTAIDCPDVIGCGETAFTDVKPIIDQKCVSCHPGYNQFENASKAGAEMVRRVNLPDSSPQRMPKAPKPELPAAEKDIFNKWKSSGFIERCENKPPAEAKHYDLTQVEDALIADLNKQNQEDRTNSRYLLVTHKLNQDSSAAEMESFLSGSSKGVNSISKKLRRVIKLPGIGPGESLLRINLRDFQLSKADWDKITAADPLKIVSLTNRGKLVQVLSENKQPWMHFDNFLDTVFRNSTLYYNLVGVPTKIDDLFKQLDVKFFEDFKNFKAMLIGTNKSPITLLKNRLITRHESLDGYFWVTYDISKNGIGQKGKNLFESPLLVFAGGKSNFNFDASEVIFSLPNGLQAYALFNAQGIRQDVAPLNVVTDIDSPISPEIRSANSCHRCHAGGIIPAIDEVRDHVIKNASQFPAGDVDLVKALYRDEKTNQATFQKDDEDFTDALTKAGVKKGADPITFATDRLLLNWNLDQTAAFFLIPKEEFVILLNQSATARAQVGQLLSGGSITYDQFVAILPVLIKDLRLFQEPLGG